MEAKYLLCPLVMITAFGVVASEIAYGAPAAQASPSKSSPSPDPDASHVHMIPPSPEDILSYKLYMKGQALLDQGNTEEALQAFQKALAIDPKMIPANLGVGDVYYARQQYRQALFYYQAALTGPTDITAQFRLALTYLRLRQYEEALTAYQYGLAGLGSIPRDIAPAYARPLSARRSDLPELEARIWLYRGWVNSSSTQYEKAIPLLRQALQFKPDLAEGHFLLGRCLSETGHPDEARSELEQASASGTTSTAEQAKAFLAGIPHAKPKP